MTLEPNCKRAKVLHLIESGGMYGAENVILNLSLEMLESASYEPIVGCIVQDSKAVPTLFDAARQRGICAELFPIKNWRLPIDVVRFIRQLKTMRADLIHSHGYKPSVLAYFAGRILTVPVTATCHLWYVDEDAPLKMRMMIRLEKAVYRKFPVVFAVSPAIREILLAAGVCQDRVHVINNGIPLNSSSRDHPNYERRWPKRFDVGPGEICVVNVGRLTNQKSQKDIIEAANELRNRGRRFKFVIAGDGELRDELQRSIADFDLIETVKLVGFTDRISDLLNIATVFVLPSRDEGMPISLLEAVAHRVPVVATNVGAVETLIKDGVSGRLIRPGNSAELAAAIEDIVDDPNRSKSYAERAYEILVSRYSSEAMFKQYDHYYRSILQGGKNL